MKITKKIHIKEKIILTYVFAIIIASIIFYFSIPYFLNYGEGTINTSFDKEVSGGLFYYQQILLVCILLITVVSTILLIYLKDLNNYKEYYNKYKKNNDETSKVKLKKIKQICLCLPDKLLLAFIFIPLVFAFVFLFMQTSLLTTSDFKLVLVILILSILTISISNIYSRKQFSNILIELENTDDYNLRHKSIIRKLLIQIVPIIFVCIVFTYLSVSSAEEKEKASLLTSYYNAQFENTIKNVSPKSEQDIINILSNITLYNQSDILFITNSNIDFIYQTDLLSDFFKKYARELALSNNNHIYDYYGSSGQGTMLPIDINGNTYYIGAYYLINNNNLVLGIWILLILLTLICITIIYIFFEELSDNIKSVTLSLKEINKNNNSLVDSKIYITSLDDIGDLIQEYNNIQKSTLNLVNQIHNDQQMLMQRERLASLGQLIGGIAHNLKTPIMSISGATEGLKDLINEYDSSIEDPTVNYEDHHQIAREMIEWTKKIKTHITYMSDVITTVKGQAVEFSEQDNNEFSVDELIKKITILMKHELNSALIELKTDILIPNSLKINGNINSLIQVINNMISNSIQAYNGLPNQEIILRIYHKKNNVCIEIQDFADGIPDKVKEKLFKEMITTKGKNGTGLGLFMSYSTIKAHFDGNITFESEIHKGTTFTITLPMI